MCMLFVVPSCKSVHHHILVEIVFMYANVSIVKVLEIEFGDQFVIEMNRQVNNDYFKSCKNPRVEEAHVYPVSLYYVVLVEYVF